MTEYVRARMPREGTHDLATTTSALHAASEGWDVLDEPTHDRAGDILPDTRLDGRPSKPKTTVAEAAAGKAATSAESTDITPSQKEN